ncbi:hypothetical protein IFR05_006235 [Cadophora sp. M221]|nr:hypothetical protein IFR05_006235 [Cadophora sp. M221]
MSNLGLPKPVVFPSPEDFTVERVFPIRNLIGDVELTPKPPESQKHVPAAISLDLPIRSTKQLVEDGREKTDVEVSKDQEAIASPFLPPPYPPVPPADAIRRIFPEHHDADSPRPGENLGFQRRRTERTQLVPATSGPPGVFPGIISDPSTQKFYRCEDEPIHTPGAVQQYGVLLALKYDKEGNLEVRIASENSFWVLAYSPEQLFNLKSFLDILDNESRENIVAQVEHALNETLVPKEMNEDTHLDIFPVTVLRADGTEKRLWCALHISKGTQDLVILEFEDFSDVFYHPETIDKTLPETPTQTVNIEVHPEEMLKSTTRESAPLRVLQIARQKRLTGVSSMNLFNAMIQAQQQLSGAKSVQKVLDLVVGIISELTGFHRVMFYRFDMHKNGCVESELVNPQASLDLFRGLHFPASDIPQQARELYKINRIRILYDRDAETARLVCRDAEAFAVPLDLSHSYLRAMSPIHLRYLGNMGVRSSMSVSIVIDDDLWGLVACHGYGELGIQIPLPVRELCRNIGECAATNIQRLLMMQRIEARKPPQKAPPTQHPAGFIAASSADLLRVFDADFGLLSIHDEARAIGRLEPYREALAILAYLQHRRFTTVLASQNINQDFPDIKYPPGINAISGCLVIPLNVWGNDFLVFFRKGQLREIRWAGNPHEKIKRAGTEYLEPRMSFKRWTEMVAGLSKDWTDDQLETAAALSLLYGRFIEIWRQKDAAGQNDRMTRLLIRNSSHEVRTPLNAIVNYLEMALENPIDETTRETLNKAHKASRSLIYVIDDLLNLTKAEDGPINSPEEVFDLGVTVSEVITQFRKEAIRKNMDLTVSTHQGIPVMVNGDAARLRQVLSNVVSNAFQHSVEGGIKVDIRPIKTNEDCSVIGITVQDAGIVIDQDNLSGETVPASLSDGQPLGVGLAVVARYVKNMKGQIRVQSELGKGTIFGIELPFQHAIDSPDDSLPMGPLSDPKGPAKLRAMSDSSNAPFAPSSHRGIEELQALEETIRSITPEALAPSPLEVPSNLTSPESHSGGLTSQGTSSESIYPFPNMNSNISEHSRETLSVLIAEDNPINARLLVRRLTKLMHSVEHVNDGQECYDQFALNPHLVDVILMDIQMPLVDGMMSTKMIRRFEREFEDLKKIRPRVPIIAVSASLSESKRFDYIESGFDAWILKPIDFGRLDFIMKGIKYSELRREAVYAPGNWEGGGWFIS